MYLRLREFFWSLLLPIAFVWAVVARLKRFFSVPLYTASVPVICVGNLHSGGSGKTPTVKALAQHYRAFFPSILSRGYKRNGKAESALVETSIENGAVLFGDEPWLLAKSLALPVYVGKRRDLTARKALTEQASRLLILDDGFQHFRIKKNISLILIQGDLAPTDSFCLPYGDLREGFSALSAADAFCIVRGSNTFRFKQWETLLSTRFPQKPCFPVEVKTKGIVPNAGAESWIAFCGIANPIRFIKNIEQNTTVHFVRSFADHHLYSENDINFLIEKKAALNGTAFLTTEKDYYKVQSLFEKRGEKVSFLEIEHCFPDSFWEFIDAKLRVA